MRLNKRKEEREGKREGQRSWEGKGWKGRREKKKEEGERGSRERGERIQRLLCLGARCERLPLSKLPWDVKLRRHLAQSSRPTGLTTPLPLTWPQRDGTDRLTYSKNLPQGPSSWDPALSLILFLSFSCFLIFFLKS